MKTATMTPRERVLATAKGLPVDQVPVMYWLNPHMDCQLMADYKPARSRKMNWLGRTLWRRFKVHGELDAGEWTRALPNLLIGYANGHYLVRLGSDLAFASIGSAKRVDRLFRMLYREDGHLRVKDPFGCVRAVGGIYLDVIEPPIKHAHDLETFQLPDVSDVTDVKELRKAYPDICILAEVSGVQQILSDILWEATQYMLALYDYPDAVKAFKHRLAFATGIDTQRGESSSPQELRREILRNYRIGRTKGRHIISMTHMMQYTMPMENVHVIFDTVDEIQAGMYD